MIRLVSFMNRTQQDYVIFSIILLLLFEYGLFTNEKLKFEQVFVVTNQMRPIKKYVSPKKFH